MSTARPPRSRTRLVTASCGASSRRSRSSVYVGRLGRAQETYLDNLSGGGGVGLVVSFQRRPSLSRRGRAAQLRRERTPVTWYPTQNKRNWALASEASAAKSQQEIEERMSFVNTYGLSVAEHAAISTYTIDDYSYINAAAANRPEWLKTVKSTSKRPPHDVGGGCAAHRRRARRPRCLRIGDRYRGDAFDNDRFKEVRVGPVHLPPSHQHVQAAGGSERLGDKGQEGMMAETSSSGSGPTAEEKTSKPSRRRGRGGSPDRRRGRSSPSDRSRGGPHRADQQRADGASGHGRGPTSDGGQESVGPREGIPRGGCSGRQTGRGTTTSRAQPGRCTSLGADSTRAQRQARQSVTGDRLRMDLPAQR